METPFVHLENTGEKREDTFTIRFCASKSEIQKRYEEEYSSGSLRHIKLVTFNEGLLEGIPNSFELVLSEVSVPGIAIFVNPTLVNSLYGIHISGIKLSLLRTSVRMDTAEMKLGTLEPCGEQTSPLMRFRDYYACPKSLYDRENEWTDWVDQLKFEITVSQQVSEPICRILDVEPIRIPNFPIEVKSRSMNLSKYYLSSHLSDASIKCEEQTFPVHLMVLSECSPAFAMMFENETKEKAEKCVEIKDARVSTVQEMLRYFYTQKVNNLDIIGFQLYELADRYLVQNLKDLCTNFLITNLNMENVMQVYSLGQKYEDQMLTNVAKGFLSRNAKGCIKNYQELQTFLKDVPPPLLDDVFRLLWRNP